MPLHDWARVDAGVYHDFHQGWTIQIRDCLNRGVLPDGYYAMADQRINGPEPDVVALRLAGYGPSGPGGVAVAEAPPRMRLAGRAEIETSRYALKANRIAIRKGQGRVVAMIEVVSPGNKDRRSAAAAFVDKAARFLRDGIHFLMIDPFPTGPRDPHGLASAIWEEAGGEPLDDRPPGRPLSVASFDAGPPLTAYIEALAVGDPLPVAPVFLEPGWYVDVPLEATYLASWEVMPRPIRRLVESAGAGARPEA